MSELNRLHDLEELKEFKVLTSFEKLLIAELRMINHSLSGISTIMMDNSVIENEEGLNSLIHKTYCAIDDLSNDIDDSLKELGQIIRKS